MLLFTISGAFITILAIPLILEKVKPNNFYGFRVAKTLDDPQIWYPANKYAGWRIFWAGIIFTLSALILYFMPVLDLTTYSVLLLVVFSLVFTIGLVQSFIYLRKL